MTTTHPPITRTVRAERPQAILADYGITDWRDLGLEDWSEMRWALPGIRDLATRLRADPPDWHPTDLPDRLDTLCAEVEASPVSNLDLIHVSDEHREVCERWAKRCDERSPMLRDAAWNLGNKMVRPGVDWPIVGFARQVLATLPDIELLLPGADAELRPVLSVYAGTA